MTDCHSNFKSQFSHEKERDYATLHTRNILTKTIAFDAKKHRILVCYYVQGHFL
jgi:hypothetical protein